MIVCDSTLYLLHFISWVSNLSSDLAIIVSITKQCLILEVRTLMEGECLFCLQEYGYYSPKYLVLTFNNTKQYIFASYL